MMKRLSRDESIFMQVPEPRRMSCRKTNRCTALRGGNKFEWAFHSKKARTIDTLLHGVGTVAPVLGYDWLVHSHQQMLSAFATWEPTNRCNTIVMKFSSNSALSK